MINTIIIGGGAAGMTAAGFAGKDTLIFEKNEKLGKKLYITGKGRCNLTNASEPDVLMANTIGNPEFLYSAFYSFGSADTMELFKNLGLPLKIERGNRVFPASDKSSDVIKALGKFLKLNDVDVKLNAPVTKIVAEDKKIKGIISGGCFYEANNVVVATGGLSYPATGSSGDGYTFAGECGHRVTKLHPSLVSLNTREKWVGELQGLGLKNISLTVRDSKRILFNDFGELMFTDAGVSGPVVLSASRFIINAVGTVELSIDLKPGLSEQELDTRLLKDFSKYTNKSFKNSLGELLPAKLAEVMPTISQIDPDKKIHQISKTERTELVRILKNLRLTVTGSAGFNEAVVTCGGVSVNEINPSTMESKLVKGLYFAGEVIDVDALTGGFNLQIAISTGYLAGTAINKRLAGRN